MLSHSPFSEIPRVRASSTCRDSSCQSAAASCEGKVGYLQVEQYAALKKRLRFVDSSLRRWVTLPKDTHVVSYPSSHSAAAGTQSQKPSGQPLRSCLKQRQHECKGEDDAPPTPRSTASGCSDSTRASSSDTRRVHFRDGGLPGIEVDASLVGSVRSIDEWIYIDRDICGFSLYEYAPHVSAFKDFASSQFARAFLAEMGKLETMNLMQHAERMTDERYLARYMSEEKELDDALKLAGVKQDMLA